MIEADEAISRTDRAPTDNMIVGDELTSMKLSPDVGPLT